MGKFPSGSVRAISITSIPLRQLHTMALPSMLSSHRSTTGLQIHRLWLKLLRFYTNLSQRSWGAVIQASGCSPLAQTDSTGVFPPGFELQVGLAHGVFNLLAISLYRSFSFLLKTSFLAVFNHRKVISVTVVSILAKAPEEQSPVLLTR